jgi:hypothetical protein
MGKLTIELGGLSNIEERIIVIRLLPVIEIWFHNSFFMIGVGWLFLQLEISYEYGNSHNNGN